VLKGTIKDEITGETLIGALVVYGEGKGTTTDIDGNYVLSLPLGEQTITYSYVGMIPKKKKITIKKGIQFQDIELSAKKMREVEIVADIAKERETPVAFTNISREKLDEELASQDIPMVLNSTPSVYATQSGGGDGDARITIRGFSQRNLAVMIDGVPVNDMENGWVYWSNWFGLDMVTQSIQVQRGLGVSKLAVPSVGGTMNIFTKGIDSRAEISAKMEIGSGMFQRQSISFNSGKLKNGWGFTGAFSRKKGEGVVDGLYTDGHFFYFKAEKKFKNHLISLSGFGAPQSHGQRSFKSPISYYSEEDARRLGVTSEQINTFSQGSGNDLGITHNEFWDNYTDRNGVVRTLNSRENIYSKPQFTLRDFWQVNDKFYLNNVAYVSIGEGGGTSMRDPLMNNQTNRIDAQQMYNLSFQTTDFGIRPNIDPDFHPTDLWVDKPIYQSVNNHFWVGLLSTATYVKNENLTYSGGIDVRSYSGEHFRKVYETFDGDYVKNAYKDVGFNKNEDKSVFRENDKVHYHDEGKVQWGGAFGQAEYVKDLWSVFMSGSVSVSRYKAIDYFRKKTVTVDGKDYEVGYADTVTVNDKTYTRDSPELETYSTDWVTRPGFTIKAGANRIIDEYSNIFVNLGYLSNVPKFNNVFNQRNEVVQNIVNEKVQAFELGYAFKKNQLSLNVNSYFTNWVDRPFTISRINEDNESFSANIEMNALHMGAELEAAYKINKYVTIEGVVALGNWTWQSKKDSISFLDDAGTTITDPNGNVQYASFDARGVHVGDAAQTQLGAKIRINVTKRLYIKSQYTWFDRYYSDFEPGELNGENAGKESWQIPSYGLMDLHAGYSFRLKNIGEKNRQPLMSIRLSVLNLLNTRYISDAQNNDRFTQSFNNFDAASASVFYGLPRRFNASLQVKF
jgi:iron complex outermembrane recepter protein